MGSDLVFSDGSDYGTLPHFHASLGFTWRNSRFFSTTIDKLLLSSAMSTLLTLESLGFIFRRSIVLP